MSNEPVKLTPEQEIKLEEYRRKYTEMQRATGEADWETFERYIPTVYAHQKLNPPIVVRAQSPQAVVLIGGIAGSLITDTPNKKAEKIIAETCKIAKSIIPAPMLEAVKAGVMRATNGCVKEVSKAQLQKDLEASQSDWIGGQIWASWPATTAFYREVLDIDFGTEENKLEEAYRKVMMSVFWFMPHEKYVVAGNRPDSFLVDDNNRLHSITSAALVFKDGFKSYCVRGVSVPAEWIENRDTLDPMLALTWPNIEQRRCAAEIIGWAKVLKKLNAKQVQKDKFGTLLEVQLPDSTTVSRFVHVVCGTGREFALPVPNSTKTARAAVAATYGIPTEMYNPEVRT